MGVGGMKVYGVCGYGRDHTGMPAKKSRKPVKADAAIKFLPWKATLPLLKTLILSPRQRLDGESMMMNCPVAFGKGAHTSRLSSDRMEAATRYSWRT